MQLRCGEHVRTLTATSAGHVAVEALAAAPRATIRGCTSRGIFVQLDLSRVIFLTHEPYRSPLTIILPETTTALETVSPDDPVLVRPEYITFPDAGIQVHIPAGATWTCPAPVAPTVPAAEQCRRLERLAGAVLLAAPDRGWSRLLPALLDTARSHSVPRSLQSIWEIVRQLRSGLGAGDVEAIMHAAIQLFGLGRGLTPSGDDFVLGLTLMLNRWPGHVLTNSILEQYNTCIVDAAHRHTTTLSASLIESASLGTSDERLVRTADYLATEGPAVASTVADVLHWGESSGIDALVGMSVAVTSRKE